VPTVPYSPGVRIVRQLFGSAARRIAGRFTFALAAVPFLVLGTAPHVAAQDAKLALRPGDHICIIGNTLADRMQHDGWLETFLHTRFPQHDLVVRNLGFSADQLTLRLRSMDFGTPDQWLSGSASVPQPKKLRN